MDRFECQVKIYLLWLIELMFYDLIINELIF